MKTAPVRGSSTSAPGEPSFALFAAWKDLGAAKAGSQGLPALVGTGRFSAGEAGTLALSKAKPSSLAYGVMGTSLLQVPFEGGTLVPAPAIVFAVNVSSSGKVTIPFTLPANTPPGVSVCLQYWIADPAATKGLAASNALLGVTD